jgi:hypothetical protein
MAKQTYDKEITTLIVIDQYNDFGSVAKNHNM